MFKFLENMDLIQAILSVVLILVPSPVKPIISIAKACVAKKDDSSLK
jgi:hypothetical protein